MVKPGWLAWKPLLVQPYCAVFWVSLRNVAMCPRSSASPQMEWLPPTLTCPWAAGKLTQGRAFGRGKGVWEREGKCPASVSLPLEMQMLPAQLTGSSVLDIMASALSCLLWEPFLEIPVPIPHSFLPSNSVQGHSAHFLGWLGTLLLKQSRGCSQTAGRHERVSTAC